MKELRTIIFDEREAASAMIDLCRRNNRRVPTGTLKSFVVEEGDLVTANLSVVDDYGDVHHMTFNQEEIAAALVSHCLSRKIPLPRTASKVITAVDGQVVLALEVGHAAEIKQLVRASAGLPRQPNS